LGCQKKRKEKGGAEGILEQIIAETFSNLGKETGIKVQETQRIPLKINKNRSTLRHINSEACNPQRQRETPASILGQEVHNLQG